MIRAVEKIRERLLRAAAALENANVPYAVAGGNAVAAWVSRVDEAAVRNTRDVDILLRRSDFETAQSALQLNGIRCCNDPIIVTPRENVHFIFTSGLEILDSQIINGFKVVPLQALVRRALISFRDQDRMHLRDLIEVGLVDRSILDRLQGELRARMQLLFDTSEG